MNDGGDIVGRVRVDVEGFPSLGFVITRGMPERDLTGLFRGLTRSAIETLYPLTRDQIVGVVE